MPTRPLASTPPPSGDPSNAEPIVRLDGVSKAFGELVVLEGVSLDFDPGRTTVVLGPSGAGKSVMLKHVVGLIRPDAGAVYFRGQRVDTLPERKLGPVRRQIGFLFQHAALFDSMTVAENLEFSLREHTRLSSAERAELVAQTLERVDLPGAQPKYPADLSGGQRKRVGLARAIILEPALILYDEPTTGLDPVRADGINGLIRRLQRELGVTSIVVTHDLNSAERVADRVVLLHDGTIRADGTMDDLRASSDRRVRSFLAGRDEPADAADLALAAGRAAARARAASNISLAPPPTDAD